MFTSLFKPQEESRLKPLVIDLMRNDDYTDHLISQAVRNNGPVIQKYLEKARVMLADLDATVISSK